MARAFEKLRRHARLMVQLGFTLVTNGNLKGFFDGTIYRGSTKGVCVPGLNCYSCPGALGACPLGSLQNALAAPKVQFPYYILGLLIVFGALLGRFVCGWLCPFGLVEDLLYRIPVKRKLRKLPGDGALKYLKYFFLIIFVLTLPLALRSQFGVGTPWFCKLICPSGTLMAGIPLVISNAALAQSVGGLFWWKLSLLALIVSLSLFVWRPFCRYICPLGALYGLFNPIAAVGHRVDKSRCTSCGACRHACKMDIVAYKTPNSMECVRCGACIKACPNDALTVRIGVCQSAKQQKEEPTNAAI